VTQTSQQQQQQRKTYPPAFKARVALEALKGQRTINEIASEYGVHPNLVGQWKKQMQEGLPGLFAERHSRQARDAEELKARLYQQIGQLQVELDWLKKKGGTVG
jgi:transposase-like protein